MGNTNTTYTVLYQQSNYFGADIPEAWSPVVNVTEDDIEKTDFMGNLEKVFCLMQAENWSPNGEARPIIEAAKNVHHTSMSVGDRILVHTPCDGSSFRSMYEVARTGFKLIWEDTPFMKTNATPTPAPALPKVGEPLLDGLTF